MGPPLFHHSLAVGCLFELLAHTPFAERLSGRVAHGCSFEGRFIESHRSYSINESPINPLSIYNTPARSTVNVAAPQFSSTNPFNR